MSATIATNAAPPNAIKVWCDSRSIYTELPNKTSGIPYVMSFPRSSQGLSKMLNIIYGNADFSSHEPNAQVIRKLVGTKAQHDLARALLQQAKIIK